MGRETKRVLILDSSEDVRRPIHEFFRSLQDDEDPIIVMEDITSETQFENIKSKLGLYDIIICGDIIGVNMPTLIRQVCANPAKQLQVVALGESEEARKPKMEAGCTSALYLEACTKPFSGIELEMAAWWFLGGHQQSKTANT